MRRIVWAVVVGVVWGTAIANALIGLTSKDEPTTPVLSHKTVSTHPDDLLCAEWGGLRKCVTAQQIYFIGAKDR